MWKDGVPRNSQKDFKNSLILKLSVIVWGCATSKGVGELRFFNDAMAKEY